MTIKEIIKLFEEEIREDRESAEQLLEVDDHENANWFNGHRAGLAHVVQLLRELDDRQT